MADSIIEVITQGIQGQAGEVGANGTNGTDGVGVPVGGNTGQVLAKTSPTDHDTGWVDPQPHSYAQNFIVNNTQSQSLLAGDVNVLSDYVKWVEGWNEISVAGVDLSAAGHTITIEETGTYEITFWASVETNGGGNSNKKYAFRLSTDNAITGLRNKKVVLVSDFAGDVTNPSVSGSIASLTAGDTITLWVAAEAAVDLTILDGALVLVKI